MLPQLDQRILSALSREDDDAEGGDEEELEGVRPSHISIMKDLIAKDRNWSEGVMRLLGLWPTIDPRLYRKKPLSTRDPLYDKGGPNNWWVDFHDPFFKSLRLRPGPDGVINIYAFEKHVQSFRLFGCRQNWPAMILWIWDYGNKLDAANPKQRLSNSYARTHNQRRRIEKMLRRRALFLVGAKAPSDQELMAKSLPFTSPEDADLEMEHVDATSPSCSTTLKTTTSSEGTGLALRTTGTSYAQRTRDDMVEGVDIEALEIIDHSS